MSDTISTTIPHPGVALVRIDVPPANMLGGAVRERLLAEIRRLDADLSIRALVLTGQGRAFCAGDDLREAVQRGETAVQSLRQFGELIEFIERSRLAVIAAVNGHAVGGGLELALGCDVRIGSTDAKFIAAGVNVGLMASVYRLPRLIGAARAKSILLTGLPVDAQTALDYGIITALHTPDALEAAAIDLAVRIASRAPLSVEAAKRNIAKAYDLTPEQAFEAAAAEAEILCASKDHRIAVDAFVTRSEPTFLRA